jgi:hypothetical protein
VPCQIATATIKIAITIGTTRYGERIGSRAAIALAWRFFGDGGYAPRSWPSAASVAFASEAQAGGKGGASAPGRHSTQRPSPSLYQLRRPPADRRQRTPRWATSSLWPLTTWCRLGLVHEDNFGAPSLQQTREPPVGQDLATSLASGAVPGAAATRARFHVLARHATVMILHRVHEPTSLPASHLSDIPARFTSLKV